MWSRPGDGLEMHQCLVLIASQQKITMSWSRSREADVSVLFRLFPSRAQDVILPKFCKSPPLRIFWLRHCCRAFHLGVAYCLAKPGLVFMQRQPPDWLLFSASQWTFTLPRLSASAHVSTANTLLLLIKASETVTVYRGHRRTVFFLPGIISLFIMCVGIIRNKKHEHGICPIAEFTRPCLHCAHSNRIPYPLFCWCRDVHLLLKNIKWILKSH